MGFFPALSAALIESGCRVAAVRRRRRRRHSLSVQPGDKISLKLCLQAPPLNDLSLDKGRRGDEQMDVSGVAASKRIAMETSLVSVPVRSTVSNSVMDENRSVHVVTSCHLSG